MDKNNQMIPFVYEDSLVRTIKDTEGDPWFVATDICRILGLTDTNMAVKGLDSDEKLVQTLFGAGQKRNVITVNEPGLYRLIFRSNKPEAKSFQRWVTHEVLPAIRRTGTYDMAGQPETDMDVLDLAAQGQTSKSKNLYFAVARLVETADRYLGGKAALKALHYFTGMPVDDLVEELEEKKRLRLHPAGTRQWNEAMVDEFVSSCCRTGPDLSEKGAALYRAFLTWCTDRGVSLKNGDFSQTLFGRLMGSRFEKVKNGSIQYKGVCLAT